MNLLINIPFALSTIIQQIRKNIQPSKSIPMVNSSDINGNIPSQSAQLAPYYRAPQTDPKLEAIKKAILEQSNFRDEAKNYLLKIPVVSDSLEYGAAAAIKDPNYEPYIIVDKKTNTNDTESIKNILTHELLHETPRILPMSLIPSNKSKEKDFTNQWGKDYMKNPNNMKEEQWAEQSLPKILYKYIFK